MEYFFHIHFIYWGAWSFGFMIVELSWIKIRMMIDQLAAHYASLSLWQKPWLRYSLSICPYGVLVDFSVCPHEDSVCPNLLWDVQDWFKISYNCLFVLAGFRKTWWCSVPKCYKIIITKLYYVSRKLETTVGFVIVDQKKLSQMNMIRLLILKFWTQGIHQHWIMSCAALLLSNENFNVLLLH